MQAIDVKDIVLVHPVGFGHPVVDNLMASSRENIRRIVNDERGRECAKGRFEVGVRGGGVEGQKWVRGRKATGVEKRVTGLRNLAQHVSSEDSETYPIVVLQFFDHGEELVPSHRFARVL